MAIVQNNQQMVYHIRIRLPYRTEYKYGNCAYSHNASFEAHNIPNGKEELYEFGKDESA